MVSLHLFHHSSNMMFFIWKEKENLPWNSIIHIPDLKSFSPFQVLPVTPNRSRTASNSNSCTFQNILHISLAFTLRFKRLASDLFFLSYVKISVWVNYFISPWHFKPKLSASYIIIDCIGSRYLILAFMIW